MMKGMLSRRRVSAATVKRLEAVRAASDRQQWRAGECGESAS